MIRLTLPLRLVSEANARDHHMVRARRVAGQRHVVTMAVCAERHRLGWAPPHDGRRYRVTLTRVGPKDMDGDNLQSACKGTRDAVAAALGIDDGSNRFDWTYAQERGAYAVRICVEARET